MGECKELWRRSVVDMGGMVDKPAQETYEWDW